MKTTKEAKLAKTKIPTVIKGHMGEGKASNIFISTMEHEIADEPTNSGYGGYIIDVFSNIEAVRRGIGYAYFTKVAYKSKITLREWSDILHVSERTMQRYKRERLSFEPLQSEKILQIDLILQKGEEVFGDENKFSQWLSEENLALGGLKPKELLDNVFGIQMIEDELVKIEYGIFA